MNQGGRLNGTTRRFSPVPLLRRPTRTPFPFTDDLTITTNKGVLKTHNVGIFDCDGIVRAIDRIDPNSSTGDFAGATGVLYINGRRLMVERPSGGKLRAKSALQIKLKSVCLG